MGAFQAGFQIGTAAMQDALDRKEREAKIKRDEEERQLRLSVLRLQEEEAQSQAQNRRAADAAGAELLRNVGVDVGATPGAAASMSPRPAATAAAGLPPAQSTPAPLSLAATPSAATPATAAEMPSPPVSVTGASGASEPVEWAQMTPQQQAQWYRDNPRMAQVTRGLQYLWTNGTLMGRLQRAVDPIGVGRAAAVASGDVGFFGPAQSAAATTATTAAVAPGAVAAQGAAPAAALPPSSAAPTGATTAGSASALALPPTAAAAAAQPASAPAAQGASAEPAGAATPGAARPQYSAKAMTLFQEANLARLAGNREKFFDLYQKGQEQIVRDVANDLRSEYAQRARRAKDGDAQALADVDKSMELLNETSSLITFGERDPKTGVIQASIVRPDKKGLFLKLSVLDQAELYAASKLLRTHPEEAYRMAAGVNKTLAEVIKAESEQARQVMTANNQALSAGANIAQSRAAEEHSRALISRDQATASKAKALIDSKVALYDAQVSRDPQRIKDAERAVVAAGGDPGRVESYKLEGAEVASVLGNPAVRADGSPMMDPLTGRQEIIRNTEAERTFYQWMYASGQTDTNKALLQYLGQGLGPKAGPIVRATPGAPAPGAPTNPTAPVAAPAAAPGPAAGPSAASTAAQQGVQGAAASPAASPAAQAPAAPMRFATRAEAEEAGRIGRIPDGARVQIEGDPGTYSWRNAQAPSRGAPAAAPARGANNSAAVASAVPDTSVARPVVTPSAPASASSAAALRSTFEASKAMRWQDMESGNVIQRATNAARNMYMVTNAASDVTKVMQGLSRNDPQYAALSAWRAELDRMYKDLDAKRRELVAQDK